MAARKSENDLDVVIIGAGIAGLSAAYQLWKRDPNLNVAVVEAKGHCAVSSFSSLPTLYPGSCVDLALEVRLLKPKLLLGG